jgi:hypothetical protein
VLTTAGGIPPDAHPDVVLRLQHGAVMAADDTRDAPAGPAPDG